MKAIVQQRLADSMALNLPTLVEREARLPRIPDKAFAVIGMRRAGKTYFLFQQMGRLLIQGVDRSRLVYFNFEDERLAGMTSADLHWIPDEYYVMSPQNRSHKVHFFRRNPVGRRMGKVRPEAAGYGKRWHICFRIVGQAAQPQNRVGDSRSLRGDGHLPVMNWCFKTLKMHNCTGVPLVSQFF